MFSSKLNKKPLNLEQNLIVKLLKPNIKKIKKKKDPKADQKRKHLWLNKTCLIEKRLNLQNMQQREKQFKLFRNFLRLYY